MYRLALLSLTLVPLAAFAQVEEPEFGPEPDRKYECHDMFADDSMPYVFVETFLVSPDFIEEIADAIPDGVSDKELAEAFEILPKIRISTVTISEAEFAGMAYQDGLDYRIDFSNNIESVESDLNFEYSLVIRADGRTAFYDFSNIESGEKTTPDRLLNCRKINEDLERHSAAPKSDEMATYQLALQQKVLRNWARPASAQAGLDCVVQVRQSATGEVISARVVSCNGDASVERSIEAAVYKASPLPLPDDRLLFDPNLRFRFIPEQ